MDAAIDAIETSNNALTRLIHEFNRDADVQKTKRKESLQRVAVWDRQWTGNDEEKTAQLCIKK